MKFTQKLMATILTVIMLMGYISTLGNAVVAVTTNLAAQNSKTNNVNVEFNSYFEGGDYSKTFELGEEAKLYIEIKVSNTGYLKNGIVQFSNANFEIDSNSLNNDTVQSSDKNEIKLKQINNSSNETIIEVPIVILTGETVDSDLFEKTTTVIFTGTYIDGNGIENSIKKEISNEVKWQGTAEVELAGEVSKFIPYEIGEEKGVLVQAIVRSGIKDNSLPVASTKLEISIPELKIVNENSEETSIKPERITAVANTTEGTNGQGSNEFSEANYSYNEETGKIEIEVINEGKDGKISWKKNAVDEYVVSYVYTGEDIYNYIKEQLEKAKETAEQIEAEQINEDAITGEIEVKAYIEAYGVEETKIEKLGKISYSIEEAKGKIIDSLITTTSLVSKGYIYANYAKEIKEANNESIEPKKDTDYEVNYIAQIYDKTLISSVEFQTVAENYINSNEEEYSSKIDNKESIYSKTVKIAEEVFNKMLGEEGKIEITSIKGEKLAEITKDIEEDASGNYTVNISNAKINEIIITTSKPITEGNITITVGKAIAADQSYTKAQMESFTKITTGVITKSYASITKINENTESQGLEELPGTITETIQVTNNINMAETKLTEPVSKAEISIETESLSTVVENEDVELRVVLDTSSNENALYQNPVLQILLPENIETVNVKNVDLLLDDELEVISTKIDEQNGRKVILITIEGTQTKYMDNGTSINTEGQNVIAKGANIVIKADITFEKLAPSASTNILLYYTNENSNLYEETLQTRTRSTQTTGVATTQVDVVSPNGVITEHHMRGYNGENGISNLTTEKQQETISINETAKEVTIGGTIVNNYSNSIENVFVLGKIPFSGNKQIDSTEELGSNFTMKMIEALTISGIDSSNVKIYYSTNGEATKDLANTENEWIEQPADLSEVKSYLIVITGELATGTQFNFDYKVELPENLTYSNSSYTTYKVYYDNKMEGATLGETKVAGIIGLTTGEAPNLSVELQSTVDTIRGGQIVKMKAIVKNSGSITAQNVAVNVSLPENAMFMEYVTGNGFYKEDEIEKVLTIGALEAGEIKQVYYYIKFDASMDSYPKEISHKVTLTADDITGSISSNEYTFNVQEGKIDLSIYTTTSEAQVLKNGDVLSYVIDLLNISSGDLANIIVTIPLPEGTKYKRAEIKDSWLEETGTTEGISYNEETNTITANIETLSIQKMILLDIEIEEFEGSIAIMAKASADGTEEHYSNVTEFMSEIINLDISELTSTPKYIKEGENVTYTLKLTNNGTSTITGINVSDTLPEGLTFLKATYTYAGTEQAVTTLTDGNVEISINQLGVGISTTIQIIATAGILPNTDDKEVENSIIVTANGYSGSTTNTVNNVIEYNQGLHKQLEEQNSTDTEEPTDPTNPIIERYKITGTAWVDSNKDGKRDQNEELLSGVQVLLIYKANSQLVTDVDSGEQKITTTDDSGKYEFLNLTLGEYLVIFLYDTEKYSITAYQADAVDSSYNSDAINMKITLNGEQRYAGVTDTIKITNSNVRDIDIGLYVTEKFDLRLDKYISKITVTTPTVGTKVYNYNNSQLTKQEIYSKDVNYSTMIVEYKIVVTNEGQVAGYAKKIIDYLPDDVKFSTELNKDWYISDNNGTVYNTALANEKIEPGETKEVTLVLSLTITDKNVGTIINNNAEIYESYNDQGIPDYDSKEANMLESEDDMSNADIMISLATGKVIIYTTFALAIIMLLGFGIFEIKRRVLDVKNN